MERASIDDYLHTDADPAERSLADGLGPADLDAERNKPIKRQIESARRKRISYLQSHSWLEYIESFSPKSRLQPFLQVQKRLSDPVYWQTLRSVWMKSDSTLGDLRIWLALFKAEREGRDRLLNSGEQRLLRNLPEYFQIYRGYGLHHDCAYLSLSWTLNLEIARGFSTQGRMRQNTVDEGWIVAGYCFKDYVLAYFKKEKEILVDPNLVDMLVPVHPSEMN